MRQLLYVIVALCFGTLLCGCNQQANSAASRPKSTLGTVAIVDLDEVARQLGRDVKMVDELKERQSSLNEQLQNVQNSYVKQLKDKHSELGTEPNDEQTKEFALLQRQANLQFNQVRQKALGNLNKHRLGLVEQFRNEAKPIAQEVAAEKGLSIVITKNDTVVFAHQAAVDITDEVIDRMQLSAGKSEAKPVAETARQQDDAQQR